MKTSLIWIFAILTMVPAAINNTQASTLVAAAQTSMLKVKSQEQAVTMVKRQYKGKVLKVEKRTVNGNPGYRVKLVTSDGRVMHIQVDAKSGQMQGD